MIRPVAITLLLLSAQILVTAPGPARAQSSAGLDLALVDNGNSVTVAGGFATVVYQVTSKRARTIVPKLALPKGWLLVTELSPFEIGSQESEIGLLSIRAPASASSGRFQFSLTLTDRQAPEEHASIDFALTIEPSFSIELSMSTSVEYILAGDQLKVPIAVRNKGNSVLTVRLDVSARREVNARLDSSSVSLRPGEARTIHLSVEPDSRLAQQTEFEAYVRARIAGVPESLESAAIRVHVIPQRRHLSNRLIQPLNLSLQSVGDEQYQGGQVGASGRFEAIGGLIDLNMIVANSRYVPMFASRETYQMSYTRERFSVQLGDQIQRLSPLTSPSEYGAGVGTQISRGKWSARGYALRSRHMFPEQSYGGASLEYMASRRLAVSVNGLHRTGPYEGTVLSLRTTLSPFGPSHALDLECALDSESAFGDPSCSVDLTGQQGGLNYRGQWIETSPNFPGPRRQLGVRSAGLSYAFRGGLRAEGSWRRQDSGYQSLFNRSTTQSRLSLGFSGSAASLSLFARMVYLDRRWDHIAPGFSSTRTERVMLAQAGFRTRHVGLDGSADLGTSESVSLGYSGPIRRYRLTARASSRKRFTLSASGERASGYLNGSPTSITRWTANVRAAARFGRTEFAGTAYRNVTESVYRRPYSSYRLQASYRLRSGHSISMQAQHSALDGESQLRTTDYRLAYNFPIGLPIGTKSTPEASLTGRIYDAETGDGLDGILMFLGDRATLSDASGRFEFALPADSKAWLKIDQRSIGYGNLPMIQMPFAVESEAESSGVLEIPVVRSASLRGNVAQFGPTSGMYLLGDENVELERKRGLGNVVVSLESSGHRYRLRTAPSGDFEFRNVLPGDYSLRIIAAPDLGRYRFEADSLRLKLLSESVRTVEFRAVPASAQVKMLVRAGSEASVLPVESAAEIIEADAALEPGGQFRARGSSWLEALSSGFRYSLIVGSSSDGNALERDLLGFRDIDLPSVVLSDGLPGQVRYRAALGQFRSATDADNMRQRLSSVLPEQTWVYRFNLGDLEAPASSQNTGASLIDLDATAPTSPPHSAESRPESRSFVSTPEPQLDVMAGAAEWQSDPRLRYTIVVGSSLSKSRAEAELRRFDHLRLAGRLIASQDGDSTRFRIALGQYPTASAADRARTELTVALPDGSWVFRIPK